MTVSPKISMELPKVTFLVGRFKWWKRLEKYLAGEIMMVDVLMLNVKRSGGPVVCFLAVFF